MPISLTRFLSQSIREFTPTLSQNETEPERIEVPFHLSRKEDRTLRDLKYEGRVDFTGKILPGIKLPKRPEINTESTRERNRLALETPVVIQVSSYFITFTPLEFFKFLQSKCPRADIFWVGSVNSFIINAEGFDAAAKAFSSCFDVTESSLIDTVSDRDNRVILKASDRELMGKIGDEVIKEFLYAAFKKADRYLTDERAKELAADALTPPVLIGMDTESGPQLVMWALGTLGKLDTTIAANLTISELKSTDLLRVNLEKNIVCHDCWDVEMADITDEEFYQAIIDKMLKRLRFRNLSIRGHKRWRHLMACLSKEDIPTDRSARKILRAEFLQSLSKEKSPEARKKKLAFMAENLTLFLGEHFPSSDRALVTKLHMLFDLSEDLSSEDMLFLSKNIKPKPGRVKADVKPIFQELDELCQEVGVKACKTAFTILCFKAFERGGWSRTDSIVTMGDPMIDPCFQLLLSACEETCSLYLPIDNLEDPWVHNKDVQDFCEVLLKISASGKPVTQDVKTFLKDLLPRNELLALKLCEMAREWLDPKEYSALEVALYGKLLVLNPSRLRSYLKNEELPMTQEILVKTLKRLVPVDSDWSAIGVCLKRCETLDDQHRKKIEEWILSHLNQDQHFARAFELLCFCKENNLFPLEDPFWLEPLRTFFKSHHADILQLATSIQWIDAAQRTQLELSDEFIAEVVTQCCTLGLQQDAERIARTQLNPALLMRICQSLAPNSGNWPLKKQLIDAVKGAKLELSDEFIAEVVSQCCALGLQQDAERIARTQMNPAMLMRICQGLAPNSHDWPLVKGLLEQCSSFDAPTQSAFMDWLHNYLGHPETLEVLRVADQRKDVRVTSNHWVKALNGHLNCHCETAETLSIHTKLLEEVRKIDFSKASSRDLQEYFFNALSCAFKHKDASLKAILIPLLRMHVKGWEKQEIKLRVDHGQCVPIKEFAAAYPLAHTVEELRLKVLTTNYEQGKHKEVHEYLRNTRLKDLPSFLIPFSRSFARSISNDQSFTNYLAFLSDPIIFGSVENSVRNHILTDVFEAQLKLSVTQKEQLWHIVSKHYTLLKNLSPAMCKDLAAFLNQPFLAQQRVPKELLENASEYVLALQASEDVLSLIGGFYIHRGSLKLSHEAAERFIPIAHAYFSKGPTPLTQVEPRVVKAAIPTKAKKKGAAKPPEHPKISTPTAEPLIAAILHCFKSNQDTFQPHRVTIISTLILSYEFHKRAKLEAKAEEDLRLLKEWEPKEAEIENEEIRARLFPPIIEEKKEPEEEIIPIAPPSAPSPPEDPWPKLIETRNYTQIAEEIKVRGIKNLNPHTAQLAELFTKAKDQRKWTLLALDLLLELDVPNQEHLVEIISRIQKKNNPLINDVTVKLSLFEEKAPELSRNYVLAHLASSLPLTPKVKMQAEVVLLEEGVSAPDALYHYLLKVIEESGEKEGIINRVLSHSNASSLSDAQMQALVQQLFPASVVIKAPLIESGKLTGLIESLIYAVVPEQASTLPEAIDAKKNDYPDLVKCVYSDSRQLFQFALLSQLLLENKTEQGLEIPIFLITEAYKSTTPSHDPLSFLHALASVSTRVLSASVDVVLTLAAPPTQNYQKQKDFYERLGCVATVLLKKILSDQTICIRERHAIFERFLANRKIYEHIDLKEMLTPIKQIISYQIAACTPLEDDYSAAKQSQIQLLEAFEVDSEKIIPKQLSQEEIVAKIEDLRRILKKLCTSVKVAQAFDIIDVFSLAQSFGITLCSQIKDHALRYKHASEIRRSLSNVPKAPNDWQLPEAEGQVLYGSETPRYFQLLCFTELEAMTKCGKDSYRTSSKAVCEMLTNAPLNATQDSLRSFFERCSDYWVSHLEVYSQQEKNITAVSKEFKRISGALRSYSVRLGISETFPVLSRLWIAQIRSVKNTDPNDALYFLDNLGKIVYETQQCHHGCNFEPIWEELFLTKIRKALEIKQNELAYFKLCQFEPLDNERNLGPKIWRAKYFAHIEILFRRNHARNLSLGAKPDPWFLKWNQTWQTLTVDVQKYRESSEEMKAGIADVLTELYQVFIEHCNKNEITNAVALVAASTYSKWAASEPWIDKGTFGRILQALQTIAITPEDVDGKITPLLSFGKSIASK